MSKETTRYIITTFATFALVITVTVSQAWTNPSLPPTGGNVSAPLTTGNGSQTKLSGDLSLGSGGSIYAGGVVAAPTLCIGGDCRNAWPAGGATTAYVDAGDAATKAYVDARYSVSGHMEFCGYSPLYAAYGVPCEGQQLFTGHHTGTVFGPTCPLGTAIYRYVVVQFTDGSATCIKIVK